MQDSVTKIEGRYRYGLAWKNITAHYRLFTRRNLLSVAQSTTVPLVGRSQITFTPNVDKTFTVHTTYFANGSPGKYRRPLIHPNLSAPHIGYTCYPVGQGRFELETNDIPSPMVMA